MMPVTNRVLQLTSRQSRMLADMGIDVWYPRTGNAGTVATQGADTEQQTVAEGIASLKSALQAPQQNANAPKQPAKPPRQPEAKPEVAPIHLYVMHNDSVLVLSQAPLVGELRHFVGDLILSQQWRQGAQAAAKTALSEFRWPLTDNPGTPERALLAFMDKFKIGADQPRLLLCSAAVSAQLTTWIVLPEESYLSIPELPELMADAEAKKAFWQLICDRE